MPEPTPGPAPTLRVTTESGTVYELSGDAWLRRVPDPTEPNPDVPGVVLRRDEGWIKVLCAGPIRLGQPMRFLLEPLGDPAEVAFTTRVSTSVTDIQALAPDA